MAAGTVHPAQWLRRFFSAEARRIGDHHLGEPNDGVERRAQLMAHAGKELGLALARLRQLLALVLDLAEQARVPDRQHRLRRERLQEINGVLRKFARLFTSYNKRSDNFISVDQRHNEARSIPRPHRDLAHRAWRFVAHTGDLPWFS